MKRLREIFFSLSAVNLTITLFLAFLTIVVVVYVERIPRWQELLLYNFGITAFIFWLTYKQTTTVKRIYRVIEYAYLPVMIYFVFKELYFMTDPINGVVYDWYLIAADEFLFGTHPTYVLARIANPVLTEILQLAYSSYYFLPVILAAELLKRGEREKADYTLFLVFYGFFLSYLGYLTIPAIGPRFTLHDFGALDKELPGLFFTRFLREQINAGENVLKTTLYPMLSVQRDAFPSGHTEVTLIVMYCAAKFKAKSRYFLIPIGILLIFATVYLRYHYVIDLIAGAAFAAYTIWSGRYLFEFWNERKNQHGTTR